jgi:hypothetical protein
VVCPHCSVLDPKLRHRIRFQSFPVAHNRPLHRSARTRQEKDCIRFDFASYDCAHECPLALRLNKETIQGSRFQKFKVGFTITGEQDGDSPGENLRMGRKPAHAGAAAATGKLDCQCHIYDDPTKFPPGPILLPVCESDESVRRRFQHFRQMRSPFGNGKSTLSTRGSFSARFRRSFWMRGEVTLSMTSHPPGTRRGTTCS